MIIDFKSNITFSDFRILALAVRLLEYKPTLKLKYDLDSNELIVLKNVKSKKKILCKPTKESEKILNKIKSIDYSDYSFDYYLLNNNQTKDSIGISIRKGGFNTILKDIKNFF